MTNLITSLKKWYYQKISFPLYYWKKNHSRLTFFYPFLLTPLKPWLLYLRYQLGKKRANLDWLNIELSSACNLNCRFCPRTGSRKDGFLSIIILKKILDEIKSNQRLKIKCLDFHFGGESLLHPQLKEILNCLYQYKKSSSRNFVFNFLTNATVLTPQKSKMIIDSQAVDWMRFSIDGGNKRDFEKFRVGAKWEKVLENVNFFLEYNEEKRHPVKTGIISIIHPQNKTLPEFKSLIAKVDCYLPRPPYHLDAKKGGNLEKSNFFYTIPKGPCSIIFQNAAVSWNGKVTVCCNDIEMKAAIGDLRKESLFEILSGEKRNRIIQTMVSGQRGKIPACKECSSV